MFFVALLGLITPSIASPAEPLKLVAGISRMIATPFDVDPPSAPEKPSVLTYLLVKEGLPQNKILLIPTGPGAATFVAREVRGGKRRVRVSVEVAPASDGQAVADQIEAQRRSGVRIERLELPFGKAEILDFPSEVGPIYLTAPVLSYSRVAVTPQHSSLKLIGRRNGISDMTVHDGNGLPIVKYIIEVTGGPAADELAAQTPCAHADGTPVQYFDMQSGDVCAVH